MQDCIDRFKNECPRDLHKIWAGAALGHGCGWARYTAEIRMDTPK